MAIENLITEQFLTIQGEGRSVGRLAYFIRLAGCNLWCSWCDSMHSVDPKLFRGRTFPVDYSKIPPDCNLIVVTGGEPTLFNLLQIRDRVRLVNPLREIEVETNGTRFPREILDQFKWNVSPKLKSSNQKNAELDEKRLIHLQDWADYSKNSLGNVIFKFVITAQNDLLEVLETIAHFKISKNLVYLMAEGQVPESQNLQAVQYILDFAKEHSFNFSPRLHIIYWGKIRGV